MKVILLDIDGCLNNSGDGEDVYFDRHSESELALDMRNVSNLKSVIDRVPDVRVVWSTDWRFCEDELWRGKWRNPRLWLERQPWMAGRVIGNTPKKMSSERFHEVKWWLDEHPDATEYAVIEDSYFPDDWFGIEKHLVRCDHSRGFTAEDADRTVMLLEGES